MALEGEQELQEVVGLLGQKARVGRYTKQEVWSPAEAPCQAQDSTTQQKQREQPSGFAQCRKYLPCPAPTVHTPLGIKGCQVELSEGYCLSSGEEVARP